MALQRKDIENRLDAESVGLSSDVSARADDIALVRAFQAGDPLAFPAIYERYRPLARHIALRMLRNPEDADEVSQETMLRVYRGLGRFDGDYRLQAWVARISANLALDAIRALGRRPARDDRPIEDAARNLPDPAADPAALVARMLEDAEVRRVLSTLPRTHREALILREFEGRSHAEIGDALGVSAPQAKALIHRAKGSFRRAWESASAGIAGFVPLLLVPFKRLTGHAADAASGVVQVSQAAVATTPTLTLVPQLAQTAVSTGLGERIAAAGMAVLVAAGVGAGAVVVRHNVTDVPVHDAVVVAAPVAPDRAADRPTGADADAAKSEAVEAITGEGPAPDAEAVSDDAALPDVPAGSSVGDLPSEGLTLDAALPLCGGCTVVWGAPVSTSSGSVATGDLRIATTFLGTVEGPGSDGWFVAASIESLLVGGSSTAEVRLSLTTPDGATTWAGSALLVELDPGSYALNGTFAVEDDSYWPASPGGLPALGALTGTLVLDGAATGLSGASLRLT